MVDKEVHGQLQALVVATQKDKPKPSDVIELKRFLEEHPEVWRLVDLAHNAALRVIDQETPSKGTQALMEANYKGVRCELGYERAGSLERMLIDHVALCWLRLQCVEQRYAGMTSQSIGIPQADYWERRLSAVQRRYLRAVESLARVRRLRLPTMQVNIADKQVNISAGENGEVKPLE